MGEWAMGRNKSMICFAPPPRPLALIKKPRRLTTGPVVSSVNLRSITSPFHSCRPYRRALLGRLYPPPEALKPLLPSSASRRQLKQRSAKQSESLLLDLSRQLLRDPRILPSER